MFFLVARLSISDFEVLLSPEDSSNFARCEIKKLEEFENPFWFFCERKIETSSLQTSRLPFQEVILTTLEQSHQGFMKRRRDGRVAHLLAIRIIDRKVPGSNSQAFPRKRHPFSVCNRDDKWILTWMLFFQSQCLSASNIICIVLLVKMSWGKNRSVTTSGLKKSTSQA